MRSHISSGVSSTFLYESGDWTPTLLNSTSTPPNASTVSATTRLHSSMRATSARIRSPAGPCRFSSASVACPASSLTSAMTTLAPSRANSIAVAFPIPCAPPVTITTLPSNVPISAPGESVDPTLCQPVSHNCCNAASRCQPHHPTERDNWQKQLS